MDQPVVSNVFGTLGAVCWSVQLTPQIILNHRRHSASGLSAGFMLFWAWAGIPLGVYNIVSSFNLALWVQPQILTTLSLVTWGQCYYYERKWPTTKVVVTVMAACCFMGAVEVALVLALRIGAEEGTDWPLTLMAVLAAVLLALGVMEQYLAIWSNRSVEGISFLFCGIDALGDATSIVSVIFEPELNILGLVIYGAEFILWCGIFACGFYFRLLPWISRAMSISRTPSHDVHTTSRAAVEAGITLNDLPSSTSVFRTASNEGVRMR